MTYSLVDVVKRKAELKAAMPELELNDQADHGYRLEALDPVTDMTVVVMRPHRASGKERTQTEMNQPTEKVVAFFEDERKRARERGYE